MSEEKKDKRQVKQVRMLDSVVMSHKADEVSMPGQVYQEGRVYEMPTKVANVLVKNNQAEIISDDEAERTAAAWERREVAVSPRPYERETRGGDAA